MHHHPSRWGATTTLLLPRPRLDRLQDPVPVLLEVVLYLVLPERRGVGGPRQDPKVGCQGADSHVELVRSISPIGSAHYAWLVFQRMLAEDHGLDANEHLEDCRLVGEPFWTFPRSDEREADCILCQQDRRGERPDSLPLPSGCKFGFTVIVPPFVPLNSISGETCG
jgi:hypothetical protein